MKSSSLQSVNPVTNLVGVPAGANWIKIVTNYVAFSAASLTNTVTLLNLVPRGIIHACLTNTITSFSGGLVAGATIAVGTGSSPTKYQTASSVFGATGIAAITNTIGAESMTTSTPIIATLLTTTGLINTLTAGQIEIYLLISVLPN